MCKVKCYLEVSQRTEMAAEWNAEEVWTWISEKPYHHKLSHENWEWMDGKSLLSLKRQGLLDVGVPTNLLPRLQSDIDRDDNHLPSSLLQCIRSALHSTASSKCWCSRSRYILSMFKLSYFVGVCICVSHTAFDLCGTYSTGQSTYQAICFQVSGTCQCVVSAVLGRDILTESYASHISHPLFFLTLWDMSVYGVCRVREGHTNRILCFAYFSPLFFPHSIPPQVGKVKASALYQNLRPQYDVHVWIFA